MDSAGPCLPPDSPALPEPQRFQFSDGATACVRLWRTADAPRGLVIALHGIQSHSGWYGASAAFLANAGYAVAWLDRRGSGVSESPRGDAPHVDRLVHDVVQSVAWLERQGLSGIPIILMAVSWGGKLAALTVARRPDLFDGLALLAPGLCTIVRANFAQRIALRTADAVGLGARETPIPLEDPALFTDVPSYQDFIRIDPLTLRRATVRFLRISLDLDEELGRRTREIQCPTLLMLAGRDRIVDNEATRRFVERFGTDRKTVIEYPQARHTLEFELGRHLIFQDLRSLAGWNRRTFATRSDTMRSTLFGLLVAASAASRRRTTASSSGVQLNQNRR